MAANPQRRKSTVLSDLNVDISAIMDSVKNEEENDLEAMVLESQPVQEPQVSGIAASSYRTLNDF